MKCLHCNLRLGNRARGICNHCFRLPGVREMYPKLAHPRRPAVASVGVIEALRYLQTEGIGGDGIEGICLSFIVREAWKRMPEKFGLPGFAREHPDSNRVVVEVVRLTKTGALRRVRSRRYVLGDELTRTA